jgi:hypothetical protein
MMRIHKPLSAGLLTLGVLAGGLTLGSSPALAGVGHGPVTGEFGTAGSGDGQFNKPLGVAVDDDPASPWQGYVYVADSSNNRVEWFNSAGKYEGQFNGSGTFEVEGKVKTGTAAPGGPFSSPTDVAVDPHTGDVWVVDAGHRVVDEFNSEGEYAGVQLTGTPAGAKITGEAPFSGAFGVAVNPGSGDVYVTDDGSYVVDEFTSAGGYITQFGPTQPEPYGLAVDSEGNVDVTSPYGVQEFSSVGVLKANLNDVRSGDVAVAPSSGDVYLDETWGGIQVFQFQAVPLELALIYEFGYHPSARSYGLAVSLNGTIYLAYTDNDVVQVFAPGPTANKPTTEAASVKGTTVTLHGKLEGEEEGYYFAYNNNGSCKGASKTPEPEGKATGTPNESATIERLEPGVQYTFCIAATNLYGPEFGLPLKVTTEWVPPLVEGVGSSGIGPFEATLEAKVNPEKQDTTCVFEYGKLGKPYEASAACVPADLGSGFGRQSASLLLENLEGGTAYQYRVVVKNPTGTSEGTGHFTTAAALVPVIEAESVSVETGKEAEPRAVTFAAQVNPELQETTSCVFEYGKLGKLYEASAKCKPQYFGKNVNTAVGVSAEVNGLEAGVDYHYCVVVKDQTGTSKCKDQVFGPPKAVTGGVLSEVPGVAPGTTAPVGGEVNPEELDTRYYVQYGTSTEYGQSAPFLPPGIEIPQGIDAGSGGVSVVLGSSGICGLPCQAPPDISLEALSPGATYHYRLVAYNEDGTTYGADMTVKVLPAPQVGPATVSEMTQKSATITTSVNPEGLHTLYELDVGTSTAYGTPHRGDAGSGSVPVPLTFHLSGLHAGDTYHFRLTASNSDGSSSEADQTFTTAAAVVEVPIILIKIPFELGLVSFTPIAFPTETGTTTTKALTNAQKLAKALKACKRKPKNKRAACIKQAHKRYGPAKKAKKGARKSR